MKKHILVVSQYFYPEQFRINDMCCEWVKHGYKVTVITGIPNYPMGKIFTGYGLFKNRHEIWNDIEIIRIPLIPRGKSKMGMIANYISFMIFGIIAGKTKKIDADCVFSYEVSPMTQVLTGISFAKRLKVPHFLYVQDLWPENVIAVAGITNPIIIELIEKMVDYIYKNTNEIFATSPSFVEAICNRTVSVDKDKVHFLPQYAEDFYKPIEKKIINEIPNDGTFKVIFTGNIGAAQGLEILPKTASLLRNENVKFVLVGNGRYLAELQKQIKENNVIDKFIMIPKQPAKRIPGLLCACEVAFLSFQDNSLWEKTIPAKLQSYMACGMPIIAAAKGEIERIINEAKCGLCCENGNAEMLSTKIKEMLKSNLHTMSCNSIRYYKLYFTKENFMDQIETYINIGEQNV